MDGYQTFVVCLAVGMISYGIGLVSGQTIEERHWQKILIEKYDATYCEGEFSLEDCK